MNRFKDKVVLVTGGNRNTGLWLVKKFVDEGAKVFMCGSSEASTQKGVEALKAMTVASGFPHSTSGGAWSTGSEQCRGSYLNANVTADSVDDFIAVALLGGFDVVHFRENWYAWRGHYPVNTNDFPRGLADLKAAGCNTAHTYVGIGEKDGEGDAREAASGAQVQDSHPVAGSEHF